MGIFNRKAIRSKTAKKLYSEAIQDEKFKTWLGEVVILGNSIDNTLSSYQGFRLGMTPSQVTGLAKSYDEQVAANKDTTPGS